MGGLTRNLLAVGIALLAFTPPARAGPIYYTAESGTGFSHLYSYETATGGIADLGILHGRRYVTDLAFLDGTLYGVGWDNAQASGTSKLFRIVPGSSEEWADWALETVRANGMERTVNAAVFDRAGDLYLAAACGNFQKLTYDPERDRWEVVGTASMGAASGGDLAFSADGSVLYAALSGGWLSRIDFDIASPTFGRSTVIGQTGCPEVYGLATVDGVLYGTTNGAGNYGASYLVRIDPLTAEATRVAELCTGVWGAAAGGNGGPIPEPSTASLVVLGGVVLPVGVRRRFRMR